MPTSPHGTPPRTSCTASLSVQDALPSASSVYGMPASRATAIRRCATPSCCAAPREIDGPEPSAREPVTRAWLLFG